MRPNIDQVERLAVAVLNGDHQQVDELRAAARTLVETCGVVNGLSQLLDDDTAAPTELAARALSLVLQQRSIT